MKNKCINMGERFVIEKSMSEEYFYIKTTLEKKFSSVVIRAPFLWQNKCINMGERFCYWEEYVGRVFLY